MTHLSRRWREVKMPAQLNGPRGLLAAVVTMAAKDYASGGPYAADAAAFFRGPEFAAICDRLELPREVVRETRQQLAQETGGIAHE